MRCKRTGGRDGTRFDQNEKKFTYKVLFIIFPDFISILQTFFRSGKLLSKFQDFFKNSGVCTNLVKRIRVEGLGGTPLPKLPLSTSPRAISLHYSDTSASCVPDAYKSLKKRKNQFARSEHVYLWKYPARSYNFCGSYYGCCLTMDISFSLCCALK